MRDEHNGVLSTFVALATFVLVVIILRSADKVLVPIAIAALLAFLLSPVVLKLMHWGLGKTASVALTTTLAFAVIGSFGWILTGQMLDLLQQLPKYEQTIDLKINKLRAPQAAPAIRRAVEMVQRLQTEAEKAPSNSPLGNEKTHAPVPVEVESPRQTPWSVFQAVVIPALAPLGTTLIVIVFVVAILLQRDDLRDRFLKVVSASRLNVATQAVNDATQRVSRYLGMQLLINACYGLTIGVGLHFVGIPNPLFWGLMATLLRFIPFIGPWVAAAGPVLLAVAIDPGWWKLFGTFGLYVCAEFITANLVEVVLYGASTGLSPIAVMVAAVFWTWIWGIPGLFLSTPLTVCLLVLGKYVPSLAFLNVLLGSRPALSPAAQFYHRMLAMDSEEMFDMAVKFASEYPLAAFYDDIFIPALILAEADRHRGTLAESRQQFIFGASRDLIDELEKRGRKTSRRSLKGAPTRVLDSKTRVLGVPAADDADEIAALMLRHLLRERGIAADVVPIASPPADGIDRIERDGIRVAYVSSVPPSALAGARQTTRRLREASADLTVIAGVWAPEGNLTDIKQRLAPAEPDGVAISLTEAAAQIEQLLGRRPSSKGGQPTVPSVAPPVEPAGAGCSAFAVEPSDLFDVVTRDLAQIFDVPVSLAALIHTDKEFWKAYGELGIDGPPRSADLRPTFMTEKVVHTDDLMIVEDVTKDPRFKEHPELTERGVRFYALMPLMTHEGKVVGNLCVVDTKPHQIEERVREMVKSRAAELMAAVEERIRESRGPEAEAVESAGPHARGSRD